MRGETEGKFSGWALALPRAELTGAGEVYLENYRDILSYSREQLCVDGGTWVLRITGRELEIKAMRAGELRICGRVAALEIL